MNLIYPKDFDHNYKGNGCGTSGWKGDLVPDNLAGIDISEPCRIHDYMYEQGGTERDKEHADLIFLHNMITQIENLDTWYTNEDKALRLACVYYTAVVKFGKKHFKYKE